MASIFIITTASPLKDINHSSTATSMIKKAEQFGANGFDQKLDTVALQKAIDATSTLTLQSGATYIIDKPLISTKSITIRTETGGKPAIILQKNKTNAFIFDNQSIKSTTVVQDILKNQSYVVLADTKGLVPGDLLHLKSNKFWYWDNRGYLMKGELHRIKKVDGKKVYLERTMNDLYKIKGGEKVQAVAYHSKTLHLDGISFRHPTPYDTTMVVIRRASNSTLNAVSVINSKLTGFSLRNTYNTDIRYANITLGTTKEVKTGYGIQDSGGTGTSVTASTFKKVRRGVDFSGDTPSRYGKVTNSEAYGPPKGRLGSGSSGFGTHSTAEYITFHNNYIVGFDFGFNSRGNHLTYSKNRLSGTTKTSFSLGYGNNVKISGNSYESKNRSCTDSFILVHKGYRGSLVVENNKLSCLRGPFISGYKSNLKPLTTTGNVY
jgi:hypothetical protein